MFRSSKLKSLKSGESLDFKFFNLQALQVPKGWEKLYVSIVCVETGKTVAKTGKALVKNGNCQWAETLTETISVSRNGSSKEIEDCLYKLVVSMGSVRSSILGESMVNLASYKSSKTAIPVSLPLKKCTYGTILQVKIQCLTPRSQLRDKQTDNKFEDAEIENDDMDDRSARSSSSNHLDSFSQAEVLSRDLSFSESSSRPSLDSTDGSLARENFSPLNDMTSIAKKQIGRQDSHGSEHSYFPLNDSLRSHHSSFNSKVPIPQRNLQNLQYGSSTDLLEASEVKIRELRAEARMWEENARKLRTNVEILQEDLSGQSNHQARLEMELSESNIECENLKLEIERVNILLEESMASKQSSDSAEFRTKEMENLQKELEREVKFHREANADLSLQLKKTQESNIELVCILQELEQTIEEQKTEIAHLKASTNEHVIRDFPAENNRMTEQQILELQESQKILHCTIQSLENSLQEKIHEIEAERGMKTQILLDCEEQWREKLSVKEGEIVNLEERLSEVSQANNSLTKEAEVLNKKMNELVKHCSELEVENLERAQQLKEWKRDPPSPDPFFNSLSTEVPDNDCLRTSESEIKKLKSEICKLEEELKNKEMLIQDLELLKISKTELEAHLSVCEKENVHLSERICGMEAQLRYMTDERESNRLELQNSESCSLNLQEEIRRQERDMEILKETHKKNLEGMKKQWLETLEECEYLKEANFKLQTTAESLMEECVLLQKSIGDLKKQKMELNLHYAITEAELRESHQKFSDMSKLIDSVEEKYCVMLEEVVSKERALRLELDALLDHNKINSAELVTEVNLELSEGNLSTVKCASVTRLSELEDELAVSKQKHVILEAVNEKLLDLLEDVKSKEEKHKNSVRRLELKLKASVCERAQLEQEISSLKDQLQKTGLLQKEILDLKKSLNKVQFENQRLEMSIDMLTGDYEQLKTEKTLLAQKISEMQTALSELDNCKRIKILLEEKVLRLEGDITAREALGAHDAELKNELSQAKRANGELLRKIKSLEEENQKCFMRAQVEHSFSNSITDTLKASEVLVKSGSVPETSPDPSSKIQVLENQLAEALEANGMYKAQLTRLLGEKQGNVETDERELREMQDRYLHMSLKCAQVEAEREQLVLRLKAASANETS